LEENIFKIYILYPADPQYSTKYKNGLTLYCRGVSNTFYFKDKPTMDKFIEKLKSFCILTNFEENFRTKELIGTGGYGKV
jgi:hypothetical protein